MTRINAGIPPSELNDAMLIAEHREIKRIPNLVRKGKFKLEGQPRAFTLGTGHVKFFYDKLGYLEKRYAEIYAECRRRGFAVSWYGDAWEGLEARYRGAYEPTPEATALVRARIAQKLLAKASKGQA